ncbi:protein MEI2-like 4 [Citrus sinensis]|nr:protein MEI2-like 4 [Citrus sinensis]
MGVKSDIISQTASGKSTALSVLETCTPVEAQTAFVIRGSKVNLSNRLRLSSDIASYGHSVDTVSSHYEEEEPFESLEEIEAQTIGNLLPDDDDLFSGVTDGLECTVHPSGGSGGDDIDDLDFFSSVGGMDLGNDSSYVAQKKSEICIGFSNHELGVCNGAVAGEHLNDEHPSRTLLLRKINSNIEDSELKALFEQYGDVRTFYRASKHCGFVTISYYDIRAARNAMKSLQNKLTRSGKLDIHYSIPKDNPSEKEINQGTLVVFNLDSSVSNDELHHIFGVYGEIKEIRETPQKIHQKYIEFYDTRAAEAALRELNSSLANQLPPELEQEECGSYQQQNSPPNKPTNESAGAFAHGSKSSRITDTCIVSVVPSAVKAPPTESAFHLGISSSVPSLVRMESFGTQSALAEPGHLQGQLKFNIRSTPSFHPHSLPECHDGLNKGVRCNSSGTKGANINIKPPEIIDSRHFSRVSSNGHSIGFTEGVFGSASNGSCPRPGHQYSWNNSYCPQLPGMMWPNSPSLVSGIFNTYSPTRVHGLPRAPSHMVNTVLPIGSHHVGSAPTVDPSLWERQHAYVAESPEASGFHLGSHGSMRISNNSLHSVEFVSHNIFPCVGGNGMDMPLPSKNSVFQSHHQRSMMFSGRGQTIPLMNSFDPPNERARNRRNEGAVNQADKKQYELDIDRILRGEDNRTTLMIKNIPNKYTSKMLLAAIDERHKGTYDFIYLPIDFKASPYILKMPYSFNKCNVGYAFINMTDPSQIVPFYQWEKFNSEKVASLAYARIQGKAALIAHFQNSSLMNEDKRCRPILFNTDGPNAGDQVPFPMGVNFRTRPGKARSVIHEENHHGSPPNVEDLSNGDAPSGSAKESD